MNPVSSTTAGIWGGSQVSATSPSVILMEVCSGTKVESLFEIFESLSVQK